MFQSEEKTRRAFSLRACFTSATVIFFIHTSFSQKDSSLTKSGNLKTQHSPAQSTTPRDTVVKTNKPGVDSVRTAFLNDSLKIVTPKLVTFQFYLDSRASSFQGAEVGIYGYYAGIMVENKLSMGLAYYRLSTNLAAKTVINGVNASTSLLVNCGSINTELIYFNSRYVSLGFPLEIAAGQYKLTNTTQDENKPISTQSHLLAFTNFGLSGTFKPLTFMGLKIMLGYRKSIYPEERTFNFNGVYSSLSLAFDLADITNNIKLYRLMKRNNKVDSPLSTYVDLFTD